VAYYNQTVKDALASLKSSVKGLSTEEVKKRLQTYGLNELEEKEKINPIMMFIDQFRNFIIYILLFAVAISVLSGEYVDAIVILVILVFNAVFGFLQEYKAEKAIEALKKLSGLKAKVLRDGEMSVIETKELVPGDILLLDDGSKIPADGRIIEAMGFQISEASLTGESVPVSKHENVINGEVSLAERKNSVFSGTIVTRGQAKVLVTGTGMTTEIGKIAGMLSKVTDDLTPLQKKLEALGKKIGMGTIIICIIVFIVGAAKDNIFSTINQGIIPFIFAAKTWFLTAVSLAVAAVPEGLPAIVTIALAIGVKKMLKRNALIRKLPSVETLGEATVICSDKTGTLTANEMTVRVAFTNNKLLEITGEGYSPEGKISGVSKDDLMIFKIGALCNDAGLKKEKNNVEAIGDPTEAALLVSASKGGLSYGTLAKEYKRIGLEPFDSIRKMMSTVHQDSKGKKWVFTKGAPEAVLKRCSKILLKGKEIILTKREQQEILKKNDELASKAFRVLAFAYKAYSKGDIEKDLIFVGLQGMIDPPHKEVRHAIERCHEAGIRVIMITGDNKHTAEAIAKEIGIEGEALDGADFEKMDEKKQSDAIKKANVFARVEPKHKMRIVELLQKQGEVVAMTGDGVNDAPAIKKADLGISMGITGTDVAKESSDMVLQDDNFTSIVNAIEEGRGIYVNITKFVNYLLSCNLGEVFVIFFAIVFGWPLPMTAVMLLWLNLVTDGLPALALSVDPDPKDLMKQPPKKASEGIMNKKMVFSIVSVSIMITVAVLALFDWAEVYYAGHANFLERVQTIAFTTIVLLEIVRLQVIRSEYKLGLFSNKWLVLAVGSSIFLQLLVIYTPLNVFFGTVPLNVIDWVMIIIACVSIWLVNNFTMRIGNKLLN